MYSLNPPLQNLEILETFHRAIESIALKTIDLLLSYILVGDNPVSSTREKLQYVNHQTDIIG